MWCTITVVLQSRYSWNEQVYPNHGQRRRSTSSVMLLSAQIRNDNSLTIVFKGGQRQLVVDTSANSPQIDSNRQEMTSSVFICSEAR
jgi:hypothetical protein